MIHIEHHPADWYHPVNEMKTLILGSFPTHESKRDFEFYYPNKQNRFWKIMAHIAGVEINEYSGSKAVVERKQLMDALFVGVQNIGKTIERRGKSSLDKAIVITKFQDILGILAANPKLNKFLLTGHSNQASTYFSFMRYLEENQMNYEALAAGQRFSISIDREINCIIGNSTSTAARSIQFDDLVAQFISAING